MSIGRVNGSQEHRGRASFLVAVAYSPAIALLETQQLSDFFLTLFLEVLEK